MTLAYLSGKVFIPELWIQYTFWFSVFVFYYAIVNQPYSGYLCVRSNIITKGASPLVYLFSVHQIERFSWNNLSTEALTMHYLNLFVNSNSIDQKVLRLISRKPCEKKSRTLSPLNCYTRHFKEIVVTIAEKMVTFVK